MRVYLTSYKQGCNTTRPATARIAGTFSNLHYCPRQSAACGTAVSFRNESDVNENLRPGKDHDGSDGERIRYELERPIESTHSTPTPVRRALPGADNAGPDLIGVMFLASTCPCLRVSMGLNLCAARRQLAWCEVRPDGDTRWRLGEVEYCTSTRFAQDLGRQVG